MSARDREFAVGDRIVTRRNDRFYYVDNGTRGTIRAVDPGLGGLWVGLELGGSKLVGALGVGEDDAVSRVGAMPASSRSRSVRPSKPP